MICVYAPDCTDFSNNGLGMVSPLSCTVTETLNGEWELTLTHPIDELGKWRRLTDGCIIRAPVPAAMTPQINLVTQQYQTDTYDVEIYKITTKSDPLRLRSGTGTNYKILGKYKKGKEVIVLDKSNSQWYEVTAPDGKHGYMSAEYLSYIRTEQQSKTEYVGFQNDVIEPRQLRDQPFRIYRVVPELDKITVHARHIFYDLLDNMIKQVKPGSGAVGASVAQDIADGCLSEHAFTFYSDLESTAEDVLLENINPVEALLGEGGMTEKYGAELARDWFDVFLVQRVGSDSNVQIRERKNLTGISYDVDETDVITRIMPTGQDADGNLLYLPELYIDSPNINAYPHPKWVHLAISSAKEVTEGDETKSKAQCYEEMRSAVRAEYDVGCDLPTVTLSVDFVNCTNAEEYKQYAALSDIFLGDSVRVIARRIGVEVVMRMTQYTYDCLTKKYTSVTLGTAATALEGTTIAARQLASGSISGAKLMLNSIGSGHLQNGSVGSLQVKNAAIQSAHIQTAAITQAHIAQALIETLNANAITAVSAKIQELAAGQITTDELYASIAMISTAQLTTANIINANIEWAQIESLAADIATISKAQITSANIDEANIDWAAITTLSAAVASMVKADIETADIDWSHIKDLATDTAIITQGTAGELYIAKLAVTEANMVRLTVGELVVKGEDGHFYSVSVDADGNVTTTLKQVSNDDVADLSIHGTEKLIEGSITAQTLNVQEIFADNATIRSLIAANLDVDTLFAREATITALNAMDITGNEYLRLMVAGKADQSDVDSLEDRVSAAELRITEDAIVSTVTGSSQYQEDIAAAMASSGGGTEMIVGTQTTTTGAWKGNASFAELKDGQQIAYWLPYSGSGNATLELTLSDGTSTGPINCYFGQSSRLTTQYPAGNVIRLTYRENAKYLSTTIAQGWWADANYNTDTYDRIRSGSIKAKETCNYFKFAVGDDEGYFLLAAGVPFDVSKPIVYLTSTVNKGYTTSNAYLAYSSVPVRNHLSTFTGVQAASLYIVGMLDGSTFTPATDYLTCSIPDAEDGFTYMLLGVMSSTTSVTLFPEHPLFRFVDGSFQPLAQVAYEAYAEIDNLRVETQTAIEQTNAAIALKADKTTVSALSSRVDSAEQQITPEAITSKVLTSAQYAFEKADGRNYCLNSAVEQKSVDGYFQISTPGVTSSVTGVRYEVSDDFFSHSNGLSRMLFSFDIKRTGIDASASSTSGVYGGFWIYYTAYAADGTTLNTTGRGFYLRTTDANFVATDSDWVRLNFGVYNFSSYNPVSVAYAYLGTAAQAGCKGTVEFRNVKIECSNTWMPWCAAPEDIYGLSNRMTSAESRISQNATNIALKVSTATYNTEKVYRGAMAPTSLYTNMLWLDTSVSPNLLKRYTGSTWVAAGAQEVKTSGITIGPNNVAITTENFLLQLLDPADNENVLMEMSADGNVGFKELYADTVISDSVAPAYNGPSYIYIDPTFTGTSDIYCRSLGEAVQRVNDKYLSYDVCIYLITANSSLYEPSGVHIRGVTGPGTLEIYGNEYCDLSSYITIRGCSAYIRLQSVTLRESRPLNGGNRNSYLIESHLNQYLEVNNCTLDANGTTYDSLYVKASRVYVYNTGLYNAIQGLEVYQGIAVTKNCMGSCSWAMVAYAGIIHAAGTVPNGTLTYGESGRVFADNVTVDYGTAIPPVTPDETTIQYATTTRSWRGSWRTDTYDVIQGVYNDAGYSSSLNWNRGCMWFDNLQNVLWGTTVKSATLTLHRKTGSGASGAKNVYLCAISNYSPSGTPSIVYNYGALGTIGRDSTKTFSIPAHIVQGLADGDYGGLCLYETPYNFGSSTYSNAYMRMSGADTFQEPYLEVVFSGGTAWG